MKSNTVLFVCVFACISAVGGTPLVIAHRGFSKIAPENTIPSFQLAIQSGAEGIETDLRLTKDGVLVALHDATLNRTTNCTGDLSDFTWDELQNCDASNGMPEYAGVKIPKFSEVIELALNHSVFIVMDYKSPVLFGEILSQTVANVTSSNEQVNTDLVSMLIGSCWYLNQITDIQTNIVGAPVQFLTSGVNWNADGFWKNATSLKINGFSINYNNITQVFVERAHSKLLSVVVWTVNDPVQMANAISYGVDGIITDDPATLRVVIEQSQTPSDTVDNVGTVRKWVVVVVGMSVFVCTVAGAALLVAVTYKRMLYKRVPTV